MTPSKSLDVELALSCLDTLPPDVLPGALKSLGVSCLLSFPADFSFLPKLTRPVNDPPRGTPFGESGLTPTFSTSSFF